jgi:ABC-2 type transport system permease protein
MSLTSVHLIEAAVVCIVAGVCCILLRKSFGWRMLTALFAVIIWCGLFSGYLAKEIRPAYETVTVTALGTQNQLATGNQVHVTGMSMDQQNLDLNPPISGNWVWASKESLCGWLPGDKRQPKDATASAGFNIPVGTNRQLQISAYPWCGYAQVKLGNVVQTVDTYAASEKVLNIKLPNSSNEIVEQSQWTQAPICFGVFFFCALTVFVIMLLISRGKEKLQKYRFLFSELVKRDFTLKYKRTALGMLWSILSPLLNLLIMWLVFEKIFGNNVNHFIIYLFAGQLIFSYFSDATNQGMTSLLENSGIFTKINVPKYMFLLSKNVSSLINFGLTLIIFFIFVAMEGLPFTLKYAMLIYPIICLVLFNIGLGLILSALFVFFRDMQYLWGILTQLIMWLSATFYSIDSYPQLGQNMFLLNPIYLFIRYFRKIVIDGQVPTIWFHLLMAGNTITVLLIGCRMYKKNNHEFLYYI